MAADWAATVAAALEPIEHGLCPNGLALGGRRQLENCAVTKSGSLMEYFEGPVEITDWAPEATAAIAKPSIAETWRRKHPVSS